MERTRRAMGVINIKSENKQSVLKPISNIENLRITRSKGAIKKLEKPIAFNTDGDEIEHNLSNLSIKDSLTDVFNLLSSDQLMNEEQWKSFLKSHLQRRNDNRLEIVTEENWESIKNELTELEEDQGTGWRYILENIDYLQEVDYGQMPLGSNFLCKCGKITESMRHRAFCILLRLARKTNVEIYSANLAMMMIDRFMKYNNHNTISKETYKYYVIVAWYLACKYELLVYPAWEDVCFYANLSNSRLLRQIEIDLLDTINFIAYLPTPITFLRTLSIIYQVNNVSHNISKLLIDICCHFYSLAGNPSNVIASASYLIGMCLAERTQELGKFWRSSMQFMTGLALRDLTGVINEIINAFVYFIESDSKVFVEMKHAHRMILNQFPTSLIHQLKQISLKLDTNSNPCDENLPNSLI